MWSRPSSIAGFPLSSVVVHDGAVFLYDIDGALFDDAGLLYLPEGQPSDVAGPMESPASARWAAGGGASPRVGECCVRRQCGGSGRAGGRGGWTPPRPSWSPTGHDRLTAAHVWTTRSIPTHAAPVSGGELRS